MRRSKNPRRTANAPGTMHKKIRRKGGKKTKVTPKRWGELERRITEGLIAEGVSPTEAGGLARKQMDQDYRIQTSKKS